MLPTDLFLSNDICYFIPNLLEHYMNDYIIDKLGSPPCDIFRINNSHNNWWSYTTWPLIDWRYYNCLSMIRKHYWIDDEIVLVVIITFAMSPRLTTDIIGKYIPTPLWQLENWQCHFHIRELLSTLSKFTDTTIIYWLTHILPLPGWQYYWQ